MRSIRANRLRSAITIIIIAIGLTALVGILTAIDALKSSINNNFSTLGANSFSIRNFDEMANDNDEPNRPLSYKEVNEFTNKFSYPGARVSVSSIFIQGDGEVKFADRKTNPNVAVLGIDENYLDVAGYSLETGRGFSSQEMEGASRIAILGSDVRDKLFREGADPVNAGITINNQYFRVVGVLESKGSSVLSSDNRVMIPLTSARSIFPQGDNTSYVITIGVPDPQDLDPAIGQATGMMRQVRRLRIGDENNFIITKSDSLVDTVLGFMKYIAIGVIFIGIITLVGAAIGLMNIMLVQVNERTREIGISMAIGARRSAIKRQFLIESILICILGGLIGIVLGIGIGNIVAALFHVRFFIPWPWIFGGILICFVTGIAAGYLPASRASRLDPIEALRYE